MQEINELLKPSWGTEKWILEGWSQLNTADKQIIRERMDDMFKDGLPFEIKEDKLSYIYTFSFLAQLEVLAIQTPLKFAKQMTNPKFAQQMHAQLLDEIFHGLVFTKIVYLLSAPHAYPPACSQALENFANFIRNEECSKTALIFLNLISEGWIEETFKALDAHHIAPKVFKVILADEHRHVCEADLYREIGLPEFTIMKAKIEKLENALLDTFLFQYKYIYSLSLLTETTPLLRVINQKHCAQLKKLGLTPGTKWELIMHATYFQASQFFKSDEIEFTPMRKMFMTQWEDASAGTMTGEFHINVSQLDFFSKQFPSETLTTLMMQSVSQLLADHDVLRNYLKRDKLYRTRNAQLGVAVKLPDCLDHLSGIVFEDCHKLSAATIANKIRQIRDFQVYCYQRRAQLEEQYPYLKEKLDTMFYDALYSGYPYPLQGSPVVSFTNVGVWGYSQTKSPLGKNGSLRFCILAVEKAQRWNNQTNRFEIQDILPMSISADHRVFDGNLPMAKMLQPIFDNMLQRFRTELTGNKITSDDTFPEDPRPHIEALIALDLNLAYVVLNVLQSIWVEFTGKDDKTTGLATKLLELVRIKTKEKVI